MIKYMRSEVYRNLCNKKNYVFLFGCMFLAILVNVVLCICNNYQADFLYGNTIFVFKTYCSSIPVLMFFILPLSIIIYGEENKHNTLKNVVSYGIPRSNIFFGKLIVELIIAFINFICSTVVFIVSAYMLLDNNGSVILNDLFNVILASIPLLIFTLVISHCLLFFFDNIGFVWAIIIVFIPRILSIIGMKIKVINIIASWMPFNLASKDAILSNTQAGVIKCYISGIVGSIIFLVIAYQLFKKKDIR